MFNNWCEVKETDLGENKRLFTIREKPKGRDAVWDTLLERVRSHYDRLDRIAEDIERLGFPKASKILSERMPRTQRARSGDLGEIVATEFVEFHTGYRVPVRRLRYKDGREMSLRGDDFLGVTEDDEARLLLLKGEAKSGKAVPRGRISSARDKLSEDDGRPTPISLLFVADRLLESKSEEDQSLGTRIRDEVVEKALAPKQITHGLFVLSENNRARTMMADIEAADRAHEHISVCFCVSEHQDFVSMVFKEASTLGDG